MRRASLVVGAVVLCGLALLADRAPLPSPAAHASVAAGDSPQGTRQLPDAAVAGVRRTEKLSSSLDELYRIDVIARTAHRSITNADAPALPEDLGGKIASKQLHLDDAGRAQVYVVTQADPIAMEGPLLTLGMLIQRVDAGQRIVQGMLPISSMQSASSLPGVERVREPDYGVVNTGSVTSQGDSIMHAADLRGNLGVTGKGVRVGVISDGTEGMAASQATGDLPASINTTTCNVAPASGSPPSQPQPTDAGAGAEGTALMEIVHDLAPDAELWFGYYGGNFGGTSLDFEAAVNCLAQNTDVVVDDVSWFQGGAYDGTSAVSQNTTNALNNPANRIRGYYTSAGNFANSHYRESYVSSGTVITGTAPDSWTLQRFQGTANTTDLAGAGLLCVNPSFYCGDAVQLAPGGFLGAFVEWNDPFPGSTNDYDLLLLDGFDSSLSLVSGNVQNGGSSTPRESFAIQNTHGVTTVYYIMIGNYQGLAVPKTFDVFLFCSGCSNFGGGSIHNFNTPGHSVPSQGDAGGGVVSLGAVNATTPAAIEYYSSQGPTADSRTKPDAVAVDGVAVTGNGGFPTNFTGTSASAPHAAAIAALLLSCNPLLLAGSGHGTAASNRTTLHDGLLNSAVDLGAAGVDNIFGHGRLDALTAAVPTGCKDTDGDGYPDGVETSLGENPNSYCATMRADVDGDGKVTILDITREASYFGQTVPPAPARLNQDVDVKITILDITQMAARFQQTVSSCP